MGVVHFNLCGIASTEYKLYKKIKENVVFFEKAETIACATEV